MGLFSFGRQKNTEVKKTALKITFGRYTDRNKTQKQYDHWDNSVRLFKEGQYLRATEELLRYIRDDEQDNVQIKAGNEKLEFSLTQGSKTFHGKVENGIIEASGRIAIFTTPPVPVMRKLLTLNYALLYTWCGIRDNALGLFFQTPYENASSWKLYSAFRELALNLDKQDDLLIEEFDELQPVDTEEIITLPDNITELKYKYLVKWIRETLDTINASNQQKYAGLNSYRLLALCLRIDYLLTPQGTLMDKIEKILDMYFKRSQETEINMPIVAEFEKILNMPKESIIQCFYQVKSTFALVNPSSYRQVADFIFEESRSKDYYLNNKEPEHVPVIYEYIAGYNLFYFGMIMPLIELNHLYFRILYPDFFKEIINEEPLYDTKNGTLNKNAISKAIEEIVRKYKPQYPDFTFNLSKLKWNSLTDFSISYFAEFDYLKLPN